jgi:hypothetical protein
MFTPDIGGVYTMSLTVNDGEAFSIAATLAINIQASNRAPVLSPVNDQTILLGQSVSIQLSGSDPDGDDISYFVRPSPLPSGARLDAQSGLFTYRPSLTDVGSRNLTFGVSDGRLTSSQSVTLTVIEDSDVTSTQLSGRVLDEVTSAPIPGAIIMVGDVLVRSDSQGNFFLENLNPSEARIWVNVDQQTAPDSNGNLYGATQVLASLVPDSLNVLPYDIFLSSAGRSVDVDNAMPVTIESADNSIRVEIPRLITTIASLGGLTLTTRWALG